ncbi:MAG: glycosyltransferase family 1 protein, partial [Ignavibacteria bacterium]
HQLLSYVLPLASVCVVPSKLSEAFGMVAVEAMSAGVLPICNYHSGMKDVVDVLLKEMNELNEILPTNPDTFFDELPGNIIKALNYLYPNGYNDSSIKNEKARLLREIAVNNFSWEGVAKKLLL